MKHLILILTALCSLQLFAEEKAITFGPAEDSAPAEKPMLVFFGGKGASASDMKALKKQLQKKYGNQYEIQTVAYPGGSNQRGQTAGSAMGRKLVAHYAKMIEQNKDRNFVIIGHSAGTDMLNAIVDRIQLPKDQKRIPNLKVVNIDGWIPYSRKADQTCWSGIADKDHTTPGYATLPHGNCKFHAIKLSSCSKWCLHARMVNKNAVGIAGMYDNLDLNSAWMPKVEVAQDKKATSTETAVGKGAGASR